MKEQRILGKDESPGSVSGTPAKTLRSRKFLLMIKSRISVDISDHLGKIEVFSVLLFVWYLSISLI